MKYYKIRERKSNNYNVKQISYIIAFLQFYPYIGEIQRIKKSVPKGDKKRSKEAQTLIVDLEKELKEKHEKELGEFSIECQISSCLVTDEVSKEDKEKSNKKKRNKDKNHLYHEMIRKHEENEPFSDANIELKKINEKLSKDNLKIVEVSNIDVILSIKRLC